MGRLAAAVGLALIPLVVALWLAVYLTIANAEPVDRGGVQSPEALVWEERVFTSQSEFARWLEEQGSSYAEWEAANPSLAPWAPVPLGPPAPQASASPERSVLVGGAALAGVTTVLVTGFLLLGPRRRRDLREAVATAATLRPLRRAVAGTPDKPATALRLVGFATAGEAAPDPPPAVQPPVRVARGEPEATAAAPSSEQPRRLRPLPRPAAGTAARQLAARLRSGGAWVAARMAIALRRARAVSARLAEGAGRAGRAAGSAALLLLAASWRLVGVAATRTATGLRRAAAAAAAGARRLASVVRETARRRPAAPRPPAPRVPDVNGAPQLPPAVWRAPSRPQAAANGHAPAEPPPQREHGEDRRCVIGVWDGYVTSYFYAAEIVDGQQVVVAESTGFRRGRHEGPDGRAALAELRERLVADGWVVTAPVETPEPAEQPPCAIGVWEGYVTSQFYAAAIVDGREVVVAESRRFRRGRRDEAEGQAALAELRDRLQAEGWIVPPTADASPEPAPPSENGAGGPARYAGRPL